MKRAKELIEIWEGNYKDLLPEELWEEYKSIYIDEQYESLLYNLIDNQFYISKNPYKPHIKELELLEKKLIKKIKDLTNN